MRLTLAASIVSLVALPSFAQAEDKTPVPPEITHISDEFFGDLQTGKIMEAWQFAMKDLIPSLGEAGLARAAGQTEGFIRNYGKMQRWSRLKTVVVADSLYRIVYYVELEKVPIFFQLQFYKHGADWSVVDARMDAYNSAKTNLYFTDN